MRYFLEVGYKGTRYAGFQTQRNAVTVQGEVERAVSTILRFPVSMTGSSRTDAGVHAVQNFFHLDLDNEFPPTAIYNLNAILPLDIVIKSVYPVATDVHSRFTASSRRYKYFINSVKDPFAAETSWYYPYSLDFDLLNKAACLLFNYTDFTSFSKKNTQAFTNRCEIISSAWSTEGKNLVYTVEANRFLRGMVRGLVATMLLVGRKKITLSDFEDIINSKDCKKANFATPAQGLFLVSVNYPSKSQ